jgi:hypothetical protein
MTHDHWRWGPLEKECRHPPGRKCCLNWYPARKWELIPTSSGKWSLPIGRMNLNSDFLPRDTSPADIWLLHCEILSREASWTYCTSNLQKSCSYLLHNTREM